VEVPGRMTDNLKAKGFRFRSVAHKNSQAATPRVVVTTRPFSHSPITLFLSVVGLFLFLFQISLEKVTFTLSCTFLSRAGFR